MGGIADYSGSLVLELPLAVATFVAAQETGGRGGRHRERPARRSRRGGARDVRSRRARRGRGAARHRGGPGAVRARSAPRLERLRPGRAGDPPPRARRPSARHAASDSLRRPDRQGGELVGRAGGRRARSDRRPPGPRPRRQSAGAPRAEGRELHRGRPLRRDGPADLRLRAGRSSPRDPLPAGGAPRQPASPADDRGLRDRLGRAARGVGGRLRQRPRGRVHGLSHDRRGGRAHRAHGRTGSRRRRRSDLRRLSGERHAFALARPFSGAGPGAARRGAIPRRVSRARPIPPRGSTPRGAIPFGPRPSTPSRSTSGSACSGRSWPEAPPAKSRGRCSAS